MSPSHVKDTPDYIDYIVTPGGRSLYTNVPDHEKVKTVKLLNKVVMKIFTFNYFTFI